MAVAGSQYIVVDTEQVGGPSMSYPTFPAYLDAAVAVWTCSHLSARCVDWVHVACYVVPRIRIAGDAPRIQERRGS